MSDENQEFNRDDVIAECGGRPMICGGERIVNFGLRPSNPNTLHDVDDAGNPLFVQFDPEEDVQQIEGKDVFLWEYLREAVRGKLKGELPAFSYQKTGSCVKSGADNATITRLGYEVVTKSGPESFAHPYLGIAYGYSRYLMGDTREGEGSSGDNMAKAISLIGGSTFDDPECPKLDYPRNATDLRCLPGPAFNFTANQEYSFSAWKNAPAGLKDRAKQHTAQFTVIQSLDQLEQELRRGRPATVAGNWGGRMACGYKTGDGGRQYLWNADRVDNWEHQQSCLGMTRDTVLGRLWFIMNNWFMMQNGVPVPVHGLTKFGEPLGGYWVTDAMIQHQLNYRFGEIRTFRGWKGWTDRPVDPGMI